MCERMGNTCAAVGWTVGHAAERLLARLAAAAGKAAADEERPPLATECAAARAAGEAAPERPRWGASERTPSRRGGIEPETE